MFGIVFLYKYVIKKSCQQDQPYLKVKKKKRKEKES